MAANFDTASMLSENPQQRPNVYQVLKEVSLMRGTDIPIKDIYAGRTQSEARRNQHLPLPDADIKTPPMAAGAFKAPPVIVKESIPDITPMRRGRPTKLGGDSRTSKPSPSPLRNSTGDPFSALDSGKPPSKDSLDDASARFPALDEFSLLHDSGSKFAFDPKPAPAKKAPQDITQRVTNALADDAFALPTMAARATTGQPQSAHTAAVESKARISTNKPPPSIDTKLKQVPSASQRPGMVSTGTMTSSPPSPTLNTRSTSNRPIFRFPPSTDDKYSNQPRASEAAEVAAAKLRADAASSRPGQFDGHPNSQIQVPEQSLSSRPSFEASHRSSFLGGFDNSLHRSRSANTKSRPSSLQGPSKPNLFRRLSREKSREPREEQVQETEWLTSALTGTSDVGEDASKIDSNVDYLKAMEEEEAAKRKEKRHSSGSKHFKRSSMPSVSLSGTKNLLAGRFGEAFRRFETNNDEPGHGDTNRSPGHGGNDMPLSPIVGSEATDGRSDDGNALEESEELPPEVRRELERRRLSQEEKRVTDGAAAYRQRLAEGDRTGSRPGPNKKAMSIQSKVKSLLDENGRGSPSPTKTAAGYGKDTERASSPIPVSEQNPGHHPPRTSSRQVPMQPSSNSTGQMPSTARSSPIVPLNTSSTRVNNAQLPQSFSNIPRHSAPPSDHPMTRPPGPPRPQPKPQSLRTGDRPPGSPLKPAPLAGKKPLSTRNPYQSSPPQQDEQPNPDVANMDRGAPDDDWESNFQKRYPDLSGLGLVETDIDDRPYNGGKTGLGKEMKVRDV